MNPITDFLSRMQVVFSGLHNRWRLLRLARRVAELEDAQSEQRPVVFFNASTRLRGLSLNAAFSLVTSWGFRLDGVPVVHFVCRSGMSRCVLGTDPDKPGSPPPCATCITQSEHMYAHADVRWFEYQPNQALTATLEDLDLETLIAFEHQGAPLGQLILPSLRWALRRHQLDDDPATRQLMRHYLLSAASLAQAFGELLDKARPQAVVLFNGIMYPEATARWVAEQRGIPAITHEVGFQPYSGFFSHGQATAYPLAIPDDFELSEAQNARLDAQLEKRFQGEFTMAGIRFWPEMRGLDKGFLQKAEQFRQVVPVFTNVVFDTSQVHANVVFPHMFAWLDLILEVIKRHTDTLFVLRAHPDEMRPGKKYSRQSVRDWVEQKGVRELPNVTFIGSREHISSYALIEMSKFVMVYNSSIGLEATLLGVPVLCGGKARYTQYPTVFFPPTPQAYRQQAEAFLTTESVEVPEEFTRNARRFLYYQFYRASLPFDRFIETHPTGGYVLFKPFDLQELQARNSPTLKTITDGVLKGKPFLLDEVE